MMRSTSLWGIQEKYWKLLCLVVAGVAMGCLRTSGSASASIPSEFLTSQLIETRGEERERNAELHQRFRAGNRLFRNSQFEAALAVYEEALALSDALDSPTLIEGNLLHNAATTARILGRFDVAQAYIDRAIALAQALDHQDLLGRSLNESGVIAYNLSQFDRALEYYQHALMISREIGNHQIEVHVLDNMGVVHRRQGRYDTALDLHQQAQVLSEEIADPSIQARILNNIGIVYDRYGDYARALQFNLQALAVSEENGDRFVEGRILSSIGVTFANLGDYSQAQEFYQRALEVTQDIDNQAASGRILNNIGELFIRQGQYDRAIDSIEDSLAIQRTIGNRIDEAAGISNLGVVYWSRGDYSTAFDYYQQALEIQQTIGDRPGEGYSYASLGSLYFSTGNYAESLEMFERARHIFQAIGARADEGTMLNNIAGVYYTLGQLNPALDDYQRALTIRQEIGDRAGMGGTLYNIGLVYHAQDNSPEALAAFQESLAMRRQVGDVAGEASTLNGMGALYGQMGDQAQAIDVSAQALQIYRQIGNPIGEATALTNLGISYGDRSKYEQALESFQTALRLFQDAGNREGERFILSSIGDLLAQQGAIELAIVFYKQSVNLTESIRQEIQTLPLGIQQTYTDTVANTYRRLADLLLQENRVLEAQRVLDLLKVQELDDYLRGVERNGETATGILIRPEEQQLFEQFQTSQSSLVALGRELYDLEQIALGDRTTDQIERIRELRRLQQEARQAFREFFESPEIQALVAQLRQTTGAANLELGELNALQDNLRALDQSTVILYPLVLADRVELILVTATSPPIRRTVSVSRLRLNQAIAEFRSALQTPRQDEGLLTQAQQIYDWLIRPLEDDLAQVEAEVVIYAPDGQLRYIPLAALHSGSQWLVERYQVNNITAASLDDLDNRPIPDNLHILAAAFTAGQYDVPISDRTLSFSGLTFAGREVESLSQLIPNTVKRINADFNQDIIYDMNDFSVVHLATHATFNPGPPENSFILFGDGSRATLTDIKDWNFPNVQLVVLSACETAVGDIPLGNGEEILGFGYLMQLAGAEAAIASLWQVSDRGTSRLMQRFYELLASGELTKAEALRQAQLSLLYDEDTETRPTATRSPGAVPTPRDGADLSPNDVGDRHPYYWAPFILIGNGL